MEIEYKGCYGPKATPAEIQEWVFRNVIGNIRRFEKGMPRASLNIWGHPGCSKTSVVKQLANRKVEFDGKQVAIKVIDIPLAQIEEMGDVLGFPVEEIEVDLNGEKRFVKAVDSIIKEVIMSGGKVTGRKRTSYAPPDWAPTEECPGVILFDDGNRASQRILKGFMQLIQDYKTIAWAIPRGWTIVFTGNPDNHQNQVTSIDTAQLTRMKHMTLTVDAKEWAIWAENNDVDSRGIDFVLAYPEMMIGKKLTNPRTLTEFFFSLPDYSDLNDNKQFQDCLKEASTCLDAETVATFGTFITSVEKYACSPEQILENADFVIRKIEPLIANKNNPRVDVISVMMDRLVSYLVSDKYVFCENHVDNFKKWMLWDKLPRDIVFATLNSLVSYRCIHSRKFIVGKEILELALEMRKTN